MTNNNYILLVLIAVCLFACDNKQEEKVNPLEALKEVDKLISELADKPQKLTTTTQKKTIVVGKEGTRIHVDPNQLETVDGTPLIRNGKKISCYFIVDYF